MASSPILSPRTHMHATNTMYRAKNIQITKLMRAHSETHSLMGGSAREVTGGSHFIRMEPRQVALPYGGRHCFGTVKKCTFIEYVCTEVCWFVCMYVCTVCTVCMYNYLNG